MPVSHMPTVWLWLGQPPDGTEHLLMVQVMDPEAGLAFRPLMAVTEQDAHGFTELATAAATQLGVRAVLRAYEVHKFNGEAREIAAVGVTPAPLTLAREPVPGHREPYVGEGADGARRSAEIDRNEADTFPTDSVDRDRCLASAWRWDKQAVDLADLDRAARMTDGA